MKHSNINDVITEKQIENNLMLPVAPQYESDSLSVSSIIIINM